jgi:hypothetical protein
MALASRLSEPMEVAYGLYVLALAGRSNVPVMNYYKANRALEEDSYLKVRKTFYDRTGRRIDGRNFK